MIRLKNGKIIVGIDLGNSSIKTVNTVLPGDIKRISGKALNGDCIEVDGTYYSLEGHGSYVVDRTGDEKMYIQVATACLNELQNQGVKIGGRDISVVIGIGIAPQHWNKLNEKYKKYFQSRRNMTVRYQEKMVKFSIEDVYVMPQGIAGIIGTGDYKKLHNQTVVVDIGGGTLDILSFQDKKLQESQVCSEVFGMEQAYEIVKHHLNDRFCRDISQVAFESYIKGKQWLSEELEDTVDEALKEYCAEVIHTIERKKIDLSICNVIVMGGGAHVMKKYSHLDERTSYILNVNANAYGYEVMCETKLQGRN